MKKILRLVFLISILLSCRKTVDKGHEEYIGQWYSLSPFGCYTIITISADSRMDYQMGPLSEDCRDKRDGKFKVGKNDFKMGVWQFDVLEKPSQIPDTLVCIHQSYDSITVNWKMKIKKPFFLQKEVLTMYKLKN